jgi:hypothetical protein
MTCGWHAATVVNIGVYRMETPTAWPVHNLAGMRSALRRLEELEKRLGQALLRCWCKDCGTNPYWDILALVDGPIQPRLCERCELEQSQGKESVTVSNLGLLDKTTLPRIKSSTRLWC